METWQSEKIIREIHQLNTQLQSAQLSQEEYDVKLSQLITSNQSQQSQKWLTIGWVLLGFSCTILALLFGYVAHFLESQRALFLEIQSHQKEAKEDIFVMDFPYSKEQIHQLRLRMANLKSVDLTTLYQTEMIPKGSFQQGCDLEPCKSHELPRHLVQNKEAFLMMTTEITQELYAFVMLDNPSNHQECDDCPVEMVSWLDAIRFANQLSQLEDLTECYQIDGTTVQWDKNCTGWRLPTESEWEYAARSNDVAWFQNSGESNSHTQSVCQVPKNAFALCDMLGNVWEWTWDGFSMDAYMQLKDTTPHIFAHHNQLRTYRGGGYDNELNGQYFFKRGGNRLDKKLPNLGFRLLRKP